LGGRAAQWGTGDDPSEEDIVVEEFLTAAEPPQHNRWKRTETLAKNYSIGFRKSVEGIKTDVTDALRTLVAPDVDRGSKGPERLGNRFQIGTESQSGNTPKSSPSSQRVSGETTISFDETYDHWVFDGEVEPVDETYTIQDVTVTLARMAEERATNDRLPVQNISSNTPGVSVSLPRQNGTKVGKLEPTTETSSIEFEGTSELDPRRVETRLKVSVDVVEGGED